MKIAPASDAANAQELRRSLKSRCNAPVATMSAMGITIRPISPFPQPELLADSAIRKSEIRAAPLTIGKLPNENCGTCIVTF